eukprot:1587044-Rhodomonas_salina.1
MGNDDVGRSATRYGTDTGYGAGRCRAMHGTDIGCGAGRNERQGGLARRYARTAAGDCYHRTPTLRHVRYSHSVSGTHIAYDRKVRYSHSGGHWSLIPAYANPTRCPALTSRDVSAGHR